MSVTSENIPLTKKILRISQVLRPEDRSKGERGISNIEPIFQFFGKEETCETSFPKLDLSIMGTFKFLALHPSNSHKSKTGAHSAGHPAMFCHKIRNRYCENERRRKKHAVNWLIDHCCPGNETGRFFPLSFLIPVLLLPFPTNNIGKKGDTKKPELDKSATRGKEKGRHKKSWYSSDIWGGI